MRAILSVSDKTGLADFARGLSALGVEIYSTGGTQRSLEEGGVKVHSVSELTGFPEILDGRVKTLHPAVHGGILARRDLPAHLEELAKSQIGTIDLVAVNLYPFVQTVARPDVSLQDALENIDIGGPTMIRASAKNFPSVLVVVDPEDYNTVVDALKKGEVGLEERKRLAQKAFQHTAAYDTAIAQYLRKGGEGFPVQLTVAMNKLLDLRYGENPHQQAAFYAEQAVGQPVGGIAAAKQLWGKELSYNNILDADAAWGAASDFAAPTVAVIKHTNPCGLASHEDLTEAYRRALAGDPVSAFGGIVALNRRLDVTTAEEIGKTFYEIVIAPGYDEDALTQLKQKRDLRILLIEGRRPELVERRPELVEGDSTATAGWSYRRVSGGFLVQTKDALPEGEVSLRTVTKREPTAEEVAELLFAWRAAKHVKSNAIILVKDKAILGMGAGQPNRVTSVHLAARAAGEKSRGSVLASDAFFPFADGVELAAEAGVTAIIEPGGSVRDEEVIAAADRAGMAMVFTGQRHFRH